MKITKKMVAEYLTDCLGYDELMVDELKESFIPLRSALNDEELKECINYFM